MGNALTVRPKSGAHKIGETRHAHRQTVTLLSERWRMQSIRF